MRARLSRPLLGLFLVAAAPETPAARAQPSPTVHPIWGALPDAARDEEARRRFSEAVARRSLGPVETMDVPAPPAPRTATLLRAGRTAVEKLKFDEAATALDAAAAEVIANGGAGLSAQELSDLFLYQAMAAQQATWKELAAPLTEIASPKAREAYLRAAVLAPERTIEPRRHPPIAVASWRLALAEVRQRPRGNIVVRASARAEIRIDGGAPLLSPATAISLPFGEHFVHVDELGHEPWSAVVTLTEASLEIDTPPRAPLVLPEAEAASHARRMGATFALVGQMKLTAGGAEIELRLLDAATGAVKDATVVPLGGDPGLLEAAVMRLDEEARTQELVRTHTPAGEPAPTGPIIAAVPAGPPTVDRPRFSDDPGGWARTRWPLLTAIGVAVGTALVLGIAVANDRGPR